MDVFGQIRHFISLFIHNASWNPSKNLCYLKHDNIHYILKKLWIGSRTTKIMTANEKRS